MKKIYVLLAIIAISITSKGQAPDRNVVDLHLKACVEISKYQNEWHFGFQMTKVGACSIVGIQLLRDGLLDLQPGPLPRQGIINMSTILQVIGGGIMGSGIIIDLRSRRHITHAMNDLQY